MFRSSRQIIAPGWQPLLKAHGLDTVAGVYALGRGTVVTRSASTEVRRIELAGPDGRKRILFIKKYWVNQAKQVWSGLLRGTFLGRSKVHCEFDNLSRLREWGLDAPEPIAFGEERRARCLVRSCLITDGVPEPVPLDLYVRERLSSGSPDAPGRRRALIDALADATRRMHEHRFIHHDYFWRNIILSGGRLDRFFLIDAHKGRCWRWKANASRAIDLAALDSAAVPYFRRTERLRFFLRYNSQPGLNPAGKALLRAVLERAEPMRSRQVRRVAETRRPSALADVDG